MITVIHPNAVRVFIDKNVFLGILKHIFETIHPKTALPYTQALRTIHPHKIYISRPLCIPTQMISDYGTMLAVDIRKRPLRAYSITIKEHFMQKVEAMIKPSRLEEIRIALNEIGINGMTVSQENGGQMQRDHTGVTCGADRQDDFMPKIKIAIVVESTLVDRVLSVISEHATAFPFVFLNVLGGASTSPNMNTPGGSVDKEPALPLKLPPEPAL